MALPSIKNRVGNAVTGTPGTGTITLASAETGYQSFATAYAANANVDILIEEGSTWEIARDCTYTHSGTTVTRGTLEASSTGSAVSFTSAAKVYVIETAARMQTAQHIIAARYGFSARGLTAEQTLTASTFVAVTNWNTEEWDTDSCFVASTGVFTPTKAGRYQLTAGCLIQKVANAGVDDGTRLIPRIYKNGVAVFELTRVYAGAAASFPGGSGSCIVQANGSTDYFDLRILYSGSTGTVVCTTSAETTYLQARYLGD